MLGRIGGYLNKCKAKKKIQLIRFVVSMFNAKLPQKQNTHTHTHTRARAKNELK